jgi:hypothetical protein
MLIGPSGAGRQLDFRSFPGASFRTWIVSDPSAFVTIPGTMGRLIRKRLIGFSIRGWVLPSYIVTNQKAFTGGRPSFGKWPA